MIYSFGSSVPFIPVPSEVTITIRSLILANHQREILNSPRVRRTLVV